MKTFRIPFSRTTLRGLYVTLLPRRPFIGRFSETIAVAPCAECSRWNDHSSGCPCACHLNPARTYSSFGLGFATVQWLP